MRRELGQINECICSEDKYGLPKSKETALCVFLGRMDLQKGYDYLLAALEASGAFIVELLGSWQRDAQHSFSTPSSEYCWCRPGKPNQKRG